MPTSKPITPETLEVIRSMRESGAAARAIERATGVGRNRLAKIVDRTRKAAEFQRGKAVEAPLRRTGPYSWGLEAIRRARDAQLRGDFAEAVRLAEAMRTDDALYVAYHNRIAPQSSVQTRLVPRGADARSEGAQRRAAASVFVDRGVLGSIDGTLANHGVAIGYIERETNAEGTRVDMALTEWPLEHVRWNLSTEQLETTVKGGGMRVPIVHGDGYWIVFRKFEVLPWTQEAAVLPGALIWAAHAFGISDWAAASKSHGQAKVVGTLPQGVSLQGVDESGQPVLTPEADAFLAMLQDVVSGETGAAISPFGSVVNFLANGSTAWQVFSELIQNREKAAARVYLGTDAILGSVGGAPGVDIASLFAVASTKLQGDFDAIEQGLNTGLYQPWAAINLGDSRYAPRFEYQLPDPDAAGKSKENSDKRTRLFDALDRMRALNLDFTQDDVTALALELGITVPPRLGSSGAGQLQLPDMAIPGLVLGAEGRAAQGLPPFGDDRDTMTLEEITIFAKGRADAAVARIKAAAQVEVAGTVPPADPSAAPATPPAVP